MESGATLSLQPKSLGIPVRANSDQQEFAELVSGDRKTASQEYFSPDLDGKEIVKSDLIKIENGYYQKVKGSKYPHHHIRKDKDIEDRLNSIIELAENQSPEDDIE